MKDLYGTFDINESVETWNHWSTDNCWALIENEINHIQIILHVKLQQQRTSLGLPNNPTDVEIEIIAQSWSEHCKHRILLRMFSIQRILNWTNHLYNGNQNIISVQAYVQLRL